MEKIKEYPRIEQAIRDYQVMESKLKDLYKQTPIFWYDMALTTTEKGTYMVFVNVGGTTKFELNEV